MANWYVSLTGNGTQSGSGTTWANANVAPWSSLATVLASASAGDTILLEAWLTYPVSATTNWNKQVHLQGQTRAGANGYAIISGNRTTPWPANGTWTDSGAYVAANPGTNVFNYTDSAGTVGGGCTFSWLSFVNVGTPIRPLFSSEKIIGAITLNNCKTINTNGLVYIETNGDGQCAITASNCKGVGYSEGMFRAFNDMHLTNCHGDGQNQFHSPVTNLFGAHVQDAIVDSMGITFKSVDDTALFTSAHGLSVGDTLTIIGVTNAAPLVNGTVYFVKSVVDTKTITLAATSGGATIDITSNGTGYAAITATASTDQIHFSFPHTLSVNDPFQPVGITNAAPLVESQIYYVKTVVDSQTITISTTQGGATLNITTDGTIGGNKITLVKYNASFNNCSFINHEAAPPAGSSKDPATTGNYAQGDGIVCEENTNFQASKDIVVTLNADRGIDLKCAIPDGNLLNVYSVNNGYAIAQHDDTVTAHIRDSFLGTTFRPSYDTDKSATVQASGGLGVHACVIEQRSTGSPSQYYVAYGSVQASHTQSGVVVPQRCGAITVDKSIINIKTGLTKQLMSAGGSPTVTPTYTETNTTTNTV